MRLLIPLLLLAAGISAQMPPIEPGVSQELARWRAARYSDVRYKLNLTLEKMSPVLKGTIEIRVTHSIMLETEPMPKYIVLDWRKISGHEKLSTISNVTVNGKPATLSERVTDPCLARCGATVRYEERSEHLIFTEGVGFGENVIKLDFTSPILTSGSAITRYIDKEDGSEYIYSLFVPSDASTAFPVFDQPDLKARFTLKVMAPQDWKVVTNQVFKYLITSIPNAPYARESFGFEFHETKPISTYVFAFAAGPFEKFTHAGDGGGNPSRSEGAPRADGRQGTLPTGRVSASVADGSIYVRRSQAQKFEPHAEEVFRLNYEAIKYFEQYFDYKFPFPKYDLVLIPEFPFGGMEHAGATFLRESAIIFPQEPTKGDHISRANLIFHEAAHQWFGDTVTMRWFDDLWLKEGFATFMAYKALAGVMPEANAWKVFYERVKQAAYQTDATRGTTAIYQPIANLSAAKSAYGNIVYNKAPAFLRQAEFYLGEKEFQTAVRAFLKKHEFSNAQWTDLVNEFGTASGGLQNLNGWKGRYIQTWASRWVARPGVPRMRVVRRDSDSGLLEEFGSYQRVAADGFGWPLRFNLLISYSDGTREDKVENIVTAISAVGDEHPFGNGIHLLKPKKADFLFPNHQDYGYGIFLLDDKSREYVLKNIQNEKDPFLRSMMWGALWDSVREGELDPKTYVELVVRNLGGGEVAEARASARAIANRSLTETDETIVASLVGRVSLALNYYLPAPDIALANARAFATSELRSRFEAVLLDRMRSAATAGERVTFFRAFVANASTDKSRDALKQMLTAAPQDTQAGSLRSDMTLRTKDKFDIVTRLAILGDADAAKLLADLEKTETSDDAKRYAYAARAGFATAENKAKYWDDFVNNKTISESWIEAAFGPWNSIMHSELTLPYLERALKELPNHKRTRKIFFVNGWLAAFIGGQRDQRALDIINKFLADNPNLDNDLRLKILENVDLIERAMRIRTKYAKN